MMEIMDDGTYFMSQVEGMIASETYWAKKKREQRENEKIAVENGKIGQIPTLSNECPTCPSKSKSIEIEKDKEIDIDNNIEQKFATFWSEYPKKVGKDKCLRWFKAHKVTDDLLDKMISSINKFKNSKQWSNPQYIPHPYTWLNRGGWDDELECNNDDFTSGNNTEIVWETL